MAIKAANASVQPYPCMTLIANRSHVDVLISYESRFKRLKSKWARFVWRLHQDWPQSLPCAGAHMLQDFYDRTSLPNAAASLSAVYIYL